MKYEIRYEPRTAIKVQALVDILVEMVDKEREDEILIWMLQVDGASSTKDSRVGVKLRMEGQIVTELSVKFKFLVSNNQAEYKALIVGLQLATDIWAIWLTICSESQIVTSQVTGAYQAKDMLLQTYLAIVKELMVKFEFCKVWQVHREENARADILSKLASTKPEGNYKTLS